MGFPGTIPTWTTEKRHVTNVMLWNWGSFAVENLQCNPWTSTDVSRWVHKRIPVWISSEKKSEENLKFLKDFLNKPLEDFINAKNKGFLKESFPQSENGIPRRISLSTTRRIWKVTTGGIAERILGRFYDEIPGVLF